MNKILYGVLSWWEIIQTCPISRQELLMKFSLNLFFIWFFVVFTKPPILVNEILKNDSHPVHLFLQRSFSWCLVGFVFREKKNNIWRLNASDAKSYEWNSEKLYFLILYLVQKKKQYLGMSRFLSHYYNSTWQLLTDSDRNESNSQKRRKLLFWWQLTFIDGWGWRGRRREPTYSRCVTSKGSN